MKIDINETLRYMHVPENHALSEKVRRIADIIEENILPAYSFRIFDLQKEENGILLVGTELVLRGKTVERMLSSCRKAAVLVCTLGFGFDSRIRTEQVRNMSDALIWDACGSVYTEYGCDAAEKEISARFPEMYLTDRFSPGYGDFSLEYQKELLRILDAEKYPGVFLTDSLLMNPMKTVTAVIGLSDFAQRSVIKGCDYCSFKEKCLVRKDGRSCEI